MSNPDNLLQVYTLLRSLRKNINENDHFTHEKYIQEYHGLLNELSQIRLVMDRFQVPEGEVKNQIASLNVLSGNKTYRPFREVETQFLLTKLDALLEFLDIKLSKSPHEIGYHS